MKKAVKNSAVLILALLFAQTTTAFAQSVGINEDGSEPDNSAILDLKSTSKGMLIPRIDFNDKPATPADGLIVYVTANGPEGDNAFYYYDGSGWAKVISNDSETDPSVPIGSQTGEMQYWDGSEWITVQPGNSGEILLFINGKPTWGIQGMEDGDVYNPTTGAIWMDRNLGASQVATSSTDANAYGDLYQWGHAADGHESRTSDIYDGDANGKPSTYDENGAWDGKFITTDIDPYDWLNPQNDNLWQGTSGTNNPCPSGYRLPTEAEWEAERTSWSSNNAAGAFASPLKLPVAGFRNYSNGSLVNVGSSGYYWSSTVNGTYSRILLFGSGGADVGSSYRARGRSVRCLKD